MLSTIIWKTHALCLALAMVITLLSDVIVNALTILTNQLHGQLCYHYPGYKKFFNDVNCKTALVFWEKYH